MGINLLGLGFTFGAKDKGALKLSDAMMDSFGGITKALDGIGSAVSSLKFGNLLSGLQLGQLDAIADKISSFTDSTTNLSTGLEAMTVANTKSAKALGTQLGYTGRALTEFASKSNSMAISLNIDANAAGKAIQTFDWAGKEFAAIGLKNAEDVAKFGEVVGADVSQLAVNLRRMREQFEFSDEDMSGFVGGLHSLGTEAAQIPEMIAKIPNVLEVLGQVTDSTGERIKGAELASFAKETTALARGFYASGQDAEVAMDSALGLARALAETRENYQQMFTGVGKEFPQMLTQLGIATGDVSTAFDLMQQGPEGFTRGMTELVRSAKDSGADLGAVMSIMRGRMKEAGFPDETVDSIEEFFTKADEGVLKAMSDVRGATADMGKLAREGFSTGRTLAESFELAQDAFIMRFRNISRKEAVSFVQDTTKQFDIFSSKLEGIAAGDGPLSAIVKKFALVHQIGAKALLPETLRPLAQIFGEMAGAAGPALGIMGQLGFRIQHLASPIAILGAALIPVGIWFADLAMRAENVSDFFKLMSEDVTNFATTALNYLSEGVEKLANWVSKVNFEEVFSGIFSFIENFTVGGAGDFDIVGMIFGDAAGDARAKIDGIVSSLTDVFSNIWEGLSSAVSKANWGNILGNILDTVATVFLEWPNRLFHYVLDMDWSTTVKGVIEGFSKAIAGVGEGGGGFDFIGLFIKIFGNLVDMSTRIYSVFWKVIKTAFETLSTVNWDMVLSNVWTGITNAFSGLMDTARSALRNLIGMLPGMVSTLVSAMDWGSAKLEGAADWVGSMIDTIGGYIREGLDYLWENVPKWVSTAIGVASDWFASIDWVGLGSSLLKGFLSLVVSVESFFTRVRTKVLGAIVGALTWVVEKIPAFLEKMIPTVVSFFEGLPKRIEDALSGTGAEGAGGFFGDLLGKWFDSIKTIWPVVVDTFKKLVPALFDTVVSIGKAAAQIIIKLAPTILVAVAKVGKLVINKAFEWIPQFVTGLFDIAKEYLAEKFPSLAGPIGTVFDFITSSIGNLFNFSKIMFNAISEVIGFVWENATRFVGVFVDFFTDSFDTSIKYVSGLWDNIRTSVVRMVRSVTSIVTSFLSGLKSKWDTTWSTLSTAVKTWYNDVKGYVDEFKSKVNEFFKDPASILGPGYSELSMKLKEPWEKVSSVIETFKTRALNFFDPFLSAADRFKVAIVNKFKAIFGSISGTILKAYDAIPGASSIPGFEDLVKGLREIRASGAAAAVSVAPSAVAPPVVSDTDPLASLRRAALGQVAQQREWIGANVAAAAGQAAAMQRLSMFESSLLGAGAGDLDPAAVAARLKSIKSELSSVGAAPMAGRPGGMMPSVGKIEISDKMASIVNNPRWVGSELVPIRRLLERILEGSAKKPEEKPKAARGNRAPVANPGRKLADQLRLNSPAGM